MAEKYKLTYFNSRALAEPIRLIFAYADVEYEDCRLKREEWVEIKENFGWGQLPVLQVGDKMLCQSGTIARFLGRKFNLAGEDEWEAAKIDEFSDALIDLRTEWRKPLLEKDDVKKGDLKRQFVETAVPKYFTKFEAQLKSNGGKNMVGKKISWVDLQLAHYLDIFEMHDPKLLEGYPILSKFREQVYQIPQIKAWIEKRPKSAF